MRVSFMGSHFVERREYFATHSTWGGVGVVNILNMALDIGRDKLEADRALPTTRFDPYEKMGYKNLFRKNEHK